jgi:hypothetical protein
MATRKMRSFQNHNDRLFKKKSIVQTSSDFICSMAIHLDIDESVHITRVHEPLRLRSVTNEHIDWDSAQTP